jgi:hypothetical protein
MANNIQTRSSLNCYFERMMVFFRGMLYCHPRGTEPREKEDPKIRMLIAERSYEKLKYQNASTLLITAVPSSVLFLLRMKIESYVQQIIPYF